MKILFIQCGAGADITLLDDNGNATHLKRCSAETNFKQIAEVAARLAFQYDINYVISNLKIMNDLYRVVSEEFREKLVDEVKELESYLAENYFGEIGETESATDVAIRLLKESKEPYCKVNVDTDKIVEALNVIAADSGITIRRKEET